MIESVLDYVVILQTAIECYVAAQQKPSIFKGIDSVWSEQTVLLKKARVM